MRQNKTTKFISALLIVLIILPSVLLSAPKKAEAIPVVDIPGNILRGITNIFTKGTAVSTTGTFTLKVKDFAIQIGKQLLMVAAKRLLAQMTQATINWINSDFHGSPLFIQNPESFFKDIAKSEIRNLVDMIGYDTFRFPFGKQTALNVINSYKSQFEINAQYSLSKVINDPALLVRYRNDFNYGGWNGFLINTQYPQNNYLGFNMIVQQNLASRLEGTLQAPAQKVQSLLQQGMGFLSPQKCESNPKYNNGVNEFLRPSYKSIPWNEDKYRGASGSLQWEKENNEARAKWTQENTCPGGLTATTPGSVAANQIMTAMSSNYRQSELAAALGNSIAAIFDALINHFMNKGLSALSETIDPEPSIDNWTYDGQSLTGSGGVAIGNPVVGTLNIPQNVSVSAGEGTDTPISGGIQPYNIIQTTASREIVNASIDVSGSSGNKLKVIGIKPGTASITVHDSSTPSKTVTVTVTVTAVGALVALPANVWATVNKPIVVTLSGGQGNYSVSTPSNEDIAIAELTGTNLIIIGVAQGKTYVEVRDSSPVPQITRVNITMSDPTALVVPNLNITAFVGQTTNITGISGGTKPYAVIGSNEPGVATATITDSNFAVTGIQQGEAQISIRDSSLAPNIVTFQVLVVNPLTVNPPSVSVGVGSNLALEANARISGGVTPYTIQTMPNTAVANAQINGNNLLITAGDTRGSTLVVIKDSSQTHPQTFVVNIMR